VVQEMTSYSEEEAMISYMVALVQMTSKEVKVQITLIAGKVLTKS
jgi:hypothetical protein